jgi:hypothetical protein
MCVRGRGASAYQLRFALFRDNAPLKSCSQPLLFLFQSGSARSLFTTLAREQIVIMKYNKIKEK